MSATLATRLDPNQKLARHVIGGVLVAGLREHQVFQQQRRGQVNAAARQGLGLGHLVAVAHHDGVDQRPAQEGQHAGRKHQGQNQNHGEHDAPLVAARRHWQLTPDCARAAVANW